MKAVKQADQSRRAFLACLGRLGLGVTLAPAVLQALNAFGLAESDIAWAAPKAGPMPARYWESLPGGRVKCLLCPKQETLALGQMGECRVRQNIRGALVTHAYGQPCIVNLDPVDQNPLNHFHPGMLVLAVTHAGCNLGCLYCQNWEISQRSPLQTRNIVPFDFSEVGRKMTAKKVGGVSFTYTEPDCAPEFTADFAQFCGQLGLKRTLCTAGYMERKPLLELVPHIDALTITYKGASEDFYKRIILGTLKPVLDSMVLVKSQGKWLEVATLILPTLNDDRASLTQMARWLYQNLGPDTPWHIERFEPAYKLMNLPTTPQATLEMARQIGLDAGLKFVYVSNLAPHPGNHTYCPNCGRLVVQRLGFKVLQNSITGGSCPYCRTRIAGVWA